MAIQVKLTNIDWGSVRTINIDGSCLQIMTEHGAYDFKFGNREKLSEALLILALQSTKKVEFLDDHRFNPMKIHI